MQFTTTTTTDMLVSIGGISFMLNQFAGCSQAGDEVTRVWLKSGAMLQSYVPHVEFVDFLTRAFEDRSKDKDAS